MKFQSLLSLNIKKNIDLSLSKVPGVAKGLLLFSLSHCRLNERYLFSMVRTVVHLPVQRYSDDSISSDSLL